MRLFKVLNTDGSAFHGGTGQWPLPTKTGKPGRWVEVGGDIVPCQNGLHLCRADDLLAWLGPTVYEAEHQGELMETDDKVVARKARLVRQLNWNDYEARAFAVACARRALNRERGQGREPDPRSWDALRIAARHARGEETDEALVAACAAAWAAAGAAARAAACAAAGDAAWAAAWTAAWAAAGDAAEAARDAACAAAGAAAWAAARDAARAAERQWQTKKLIAILDKP